MTLEENRRYNELLEKFNNNAELIELLDYVVKDYQDTTLENIKSNEPFSNSVPLMSAGIWNLRDELSKDRNIEVKSEKEEGFEGTI